MIFSSKSLGASSVSCTRTLSAFCTTADTNPLSLSFSAPNSFPAQSSSHTLTSDFAKSFASSESFEPQKCVLPTILSDIITPELITVYVTSFLISFAPGMTSNPSVSKQMSGRTPFLLSTSSPYPFILLPLPAISATPCSPPAVRSQYHLFSDGINADHFVISSLEGKVISFILIFISCFFCSLSSHLPSHCFISEFSNTQSFSSAALLLKAVLPIMLSHTIFVSLITVYNSSFITTFSLTLSFNWLLSIKSAGRTPCFVSALLKLSEILLFAPTTPTRADIAAAFLFG